MSGTRIPESIPVFNQYINKTDNYLQIVIVPTNGERMGLTTTNVSDWNNKRKYWHDTLYPKYSDELQSTTAVKKEVRKFIKDFHAFGNPLLDIMAAAPGTTEDDAILFNFVLVRAKPTHPTEPIAEKCFITLVSLGDGKFKCGCRSATDSKRPSRPKRADSVEIAYKIDAPPRTNEDDGTTKKRFTKASFIFDAGSANIGKKIYIYARWINTKHEELAGNWGVMVMTWIS